MATKNDITGDALISRLPSQAYKDNYDLIFRRKGNPEKEKEDETQEVKQDQSQETIV